MRDVVLEGVRAGDSVVAIGVSGSGKSTLILKFIEELQSCKTYIGVMQSIEEFAVDNTGDLTRNALVISKHSYSDTVRLMKDALSTSQTIVEIPVASEEDLEKILIDNSIKSKSKCWVIKVVYKDGVRTYHVSSLELNPVCAITNLGEW